MRESTIEKELAKQAKAAGLQIRKFVSPGHRGVVDRLIFGKRGIVVQVEVKTPGGTPEPHQLREHAKMRNLEHPVIVLDSLEMVPGIIRFAEGEYGYPPYCDSCKHYPTINCCACLDCTDRHNLCNWEFYPND